MCKKIHRCMVYMDERCGQLEYGNTVTSDCAFRLALTSGTSIHTVYYSIIHKICVPVLVVSFAFF